jgi:hypothetical protein
MYQSNEPTCREGHLVRISNWRYHLWLLSSVFKRLEEAGLKMWLNTDEYHVNVIDMLLDRWYNDQHYEITRRIKEMVSFFGLPGLPLMIFCFCERLSWIFSGVSCLSQWMGKERCSLWWTAHPRYCVARSVRIRSTYWSSHRTYFYGWLLMFAFFFLC